MEYISFGREKLVVTLSEEDMRFYGLSESGDVSGENTTCLRKIMEEIEKNTGFDARGSRVEVRVFPSKSGGCELYLFRSPYVENGRRISASRKLMLPGVCFRKKESDPESDADGKNGSVPSSYADDCVIYRFENLGDALKLCSRLKDCKYKGKSGVYYIKTTPGSEKKTFYVAFSDEITYAGEYNGTLLPSKCYYFVKEHGYLICRDAVSEIPPVY